jgi:uncharacterized protein YeaO (DUF488 family)
VAALIFFCYNQYMLDLKRVYETPTKSDGQRILVERLWPRGLTKEKAKIDMWLKEIAPSQELRKWYNHEIDKWPEFQKKYKDELKANKIAVERLKQLLKKGNTTFVYGAKDTEHNSALVLKEFIE